MPWTVRLVREDNCRDICQEKAHGGCNPEGAKWRAEATSDKGEEKQTFFCSNHAAAFAHRNKLLFPPKMPAVFDNTNIATIIRR